MLKKEEYGGGYGDNMDVQDFSLDLLHIIAPEGGAVAFDRLPIGEEFGEPYCRSYQDLDSSFLSFLVLLFFDLPTAVIFSPIIVHRVRPN